MGLFSRKKRKDKQKHKDIQKHKRPLPVIEALEPRILLSADLPGLDVGDFDVDDAADTDVDRILAEALEAFEAEAAKASADQSDIREAPAEELAETVPPSTEFDDETRHELIIVDPSVPDYELLLADVNAVGGEATRLNVVLIDPQRSGIDQISEILASRSELDAIHLISHGSDAAIRIGGDTLDLALLQSEPEAISGWGGALSEEGDILIYGCNVTETEAGQVLIDTLAEMTRADVAASDDLTGHESLGGDWELEYRAGSIETDVAPSLTAQGEWVETLAAPVLSGANDLTAIDEDPASNPGTLVSALVAGQVSDPDGPSSGIAVVAVDDTNGTWEYTTDGGTNWTAFDAVDTTTARLLAADANTSVRFVPDADWNGAVTNGVTFHAWDQTSGTAGGTADLNNSYTVRDEFSTVSYTNNDGSANWVSGWSENDDSGIAGPTGGEIRITGGQLRLDDAISTVGAHASLTRHVDLSNATSATFSFDYDGNSSGMPDRFKAWASDNSGSTWVELEHFTPAQTGLFSGSGSYDLSSFIGLTSDVVIKFSLEEGFASGTDYVDFDNVQIEYTSADNVGGVTAYSAASASASITVNPVNYAPTDLSGGIEVNTDGGNDAYLISNTGLSQSLTATTVEIRFAANDTPYEPVFMSFNNPTDDELSIQIDEPSKNLEIDFGAGTVAYASAIDYRAALVDGSVHTLSVTWDNGAGDWSVYIDGVFTESGTGLSAGTSLDTTNGQFVFGQEQDGLDSGYDSSQHFSGTFYDVRIWNDVRTAAEIAQNYQQQLDLTPAEAAAVGLVANWQMDGFDGSNQVVDIVSANNLGIAHVSGTGFTTGAVESQLSVDEGSANGTRIGYVTAADADPGETFSYSLTDAAGGRFVIDPVTGEITVANGSLLDYETATSHDITVRVEDSGGLSYNEVLTIQVNDVNYFAPVLAGANDLTAINEDNVNNSGTLVSTLIAGHFTDAEGGASMGIAVIAVDDTNGTWQYTIDGGSNWLSFGAVDTASARMLADDASTSVRFVPDADWNGTVTDGITFYAWDQTSGSNGAAADLTGTINETVLDQFDAVSYGGDDGSVGWVGDWQEVGDSDGSAVGDVSISTAGSVIAGPYLRIDLSTLGTGISRAVDLSSATSATLSFTYEQNTTSLGGQVALEVFDGSSWHTVQTYDIDSDFYTGTVGVYQSFDISAYADANTEIRFRTTEAATGDEIYLDDVQIAYTRASLDVGAATAFSAATASSSVVVNPVNDAPVVSSPSGTYPYTEGAGAVVLGGSATVKDVDSADFAGGQLVYQITNNGLAEDRLDIRNQGTSAGQIGVSGTDITYGGVVIGTYTGATTGGTALVVSFNSSASEAAVEATLQNVTYENTSDDPTASTRTLQVYATDGDGGTSSTVTGYVAVTPVNDAPLNTFPTAPSTDQNTNLAFTGPNQIQIADVDHSGGNLRVQLSVGAGGLLTFGDMTGLTFSTGDGTDDANMVFTGSLTDINAALGTLVFKPSADFHGSVSFSINTNDLGNSGTDPGTSGDAGSEEDFDTFNITVKPPGALWLATEGDVADPSGVPGLSSWSSGTVLELGDPNLSLEPGTTDGTLSALMNFDAMVADGNADIASLDYVSRDVTVGTDAGYEFQLLQGDVLVTFASTETLDGTMYNADSLLVFRPTIVGDFSAGTWMRLLENPIGQGIGSVALVEQDTAIGGYTVTAGNFLMVAYGGTDIRYVDVTRTGSGTTAAASSVLIQGAAIGLGNGSQSIDALELIHSDVTIGGASLTAGQLLIGLESTDSSVGSTSPIEVTDQDIAVLTVTATELTGAPVGEGTVSLFLQGSDIGLNTTAERNAALALWTDPGDVDPPETDNVAASGNEDATSISITLTGSDAGGTIDFFRLNGLPANGTLYTDVALTTVASAGLDYAATGEALTLYFVPDADWNGTATFDYVARDDSGLLDTSPATATITVNPLNDDPASNADAYSVDEDASLTVDWWDSDWSRRQELTFDNLAQTETLTDFPVLIVLNASNIDYALTKDDGSDLRFFAADGTPLAYQIEEWNEGGDSSVWVRVPQITGNSNSDSIMMYYGNAAADPVGSVTGVWDSDFVGVWHLNEEQAGTGTSGIYEDATGQGHDGIDRIAATGQDGQVTDGQQFGANDWIEIAQDPSLDLKDSMTISFWIKPTSDSGTFNRVVEKGLWGYNDSYYFGGGNGTNDLTFYLNGQEVIDTADGVLTVGVWQHAAVSYTSNGDGTGTALSGRGGDSHRQLHQRRRPR